MYSHIGQNTSKFCKHFAMGHFLRSVSKNSKGLFFKNIVTVVKATQISGAIKNISSCDAKIISSKKILQRNVLQNIFWRLFGEKLRKKSSTRKYFWNSDSAVLANKKNRSSAESVVNQQPILQSVTPRSNGNCGLLGHRSSSLFASNDRHKIHSSVRTFVTSQNSFAASYDFPILPLCTKSRMVPKLRTNIKPITQSYMPLTPLIDARNEPEKVYRKIKKSCKSLVADLMYSFPFNTHSDRTKESTAPKLNPMDAQQNHTNLMNDKFSAKPRHSIWSITDNFSFPNINRRYDNEVSAKSKDDEMEDILTTNLPIANIGN